MDYRPCTNLLRMLVAWIVLAISDTQRTCTTLITLWVCCSTHALAALAASEWLHLKDGANRVSERGEYVLWIQRSSS
jgi:hypothetical protein